MNTEPLGILNIPRVLTFGDLTLEQIGVIVVVYSLQQSNKEELVEWLDNDQFQNIFSDLVDLEILSFEKRETEDGFDVIINIPNED
jgi:hypothetical protein